MKLKIIAKPFALVLRGLNSYITAAIRAPQLKSTHAPKVRRLVYSKMLQISKHIVSAIKKENVFQISASESEGEGKKFKLNRTR